MPNSDTLIEALPRHERAHEPTGKHVARAIRVDDLGVRELAHGVDLRRGVVGRGGDGRVGALGDDDDARARGVHFLEGGEGDGDTLGVLVLYLFM